MNSIWNLLHTTQTKLADIFESALEALEGLFLIPGEQIPIVMLVVFLGICIALFIISWQRASRVKPWLLLGACGMVPIAVLAVIISLESMRGEPDDRCQKYDGGVLSLTVISVEKIQQERYGILGNEWILLLVRSARWGNNPQLCRVSTDSDIGKILLDWFYPKNKKGEREHFNTFGEGEVTITLGGKREEPNVTFKPTAKPDQKSAPPEPSRKRIF